MDQLELNLYAMIENLFVISTILIGSEIIYRILQIIKETISYKRYYTKNYRYWNIIKYGFTFNDTSKYLLYILSMFDIVMIARNFNIETLKIFDEKVLTIIPFYIALRWLKFDHSYIDTAEWIRSTSGLDYATGMASNYFHGYIHLQLPEKGDSIKSFCKRIELYEEKEHVKFAIKRLVILIPHSLHFRPQIISKILQNAKPLETTIIGRAGVARPFKNDVYRFTEPIHGEHYYVAVEAATPLISFREAMLDAVTGTPQMKDMQREILMQFYKSIKKFTTENLATKGLCEFVYYNDYDDDGKETDVGYVLKHHIEKILREEN